MRRFRLPLGFAVSVLLIGLVALFATLQYRWLGQASEADREQIRRSVNERARQFATDFDREVALVHTHLQAPDDADGANEGERIAQRIAGWREASRFKDLVSGVYTVRVAGETAVLFRFSPERRALEATEWPDRLAPFRARLNHYLLDAARLPLTPPAGVAAVDLRAPALLIPPERNSLTYTIAEFDPGVIQSMLAALTRQYFGGENGEPYRVAVLDAAGKPVFTSDARAAEIAAAADASTALFRTPLNFTRQGQSTFELRTLGSRDTRSEPAPNRAVIFSSGARINLIGRMPDGTATRLADTWTLVLQHASGSIEAAVVAGRRRNLWVSFGILSLMVAGMALVMVNARRSQRLAAQQMEFVTTVSHELRTPVAAMRAAAQNLSAGVVPDPERIRLYGDLIENEGRRLTEMVEQVLAFSGAERLLNAVPVQPSEVVERAVESCRPQAASAGCTIDLDIASDLPTITGESNALERAVSNLIANAVKHGADGQWVGVSVRAVEGSGGRPEVEIAVSDRGQGVDPEDLPRIFEPFYRGRRALDRQIQGSGLGLSLVRRIAEAHGGRATVRTVPGQGATFTIHLPA